MRISVVGINDFGNNSISNLEGCVNDAEQMADVLSLRYPSSEVSLVIDKRATKELIIERRKWALEDEECIIYHSGHGTYVPDRNYEPKSEGRYDEAIVPSMMNSDKDLILDDEARNIINNSACKKVTLIYDTCFAGGMYRSTNKVKSTFPWKDIMFRERVYRNRGISLSKAPSLYKNKNVVMFSACSEKQVSYEDNSSRPIMGAFTRQLIASMKIHPNPIDVSEHLEYISKNIKHRQDPMIIQNRRDTKFNL